MTTNQRRNLHHTINSLTPDQVAAIVRRTHPRVKAGHVDTIAKRVIAGAHRLVSPRQRKIPRG
jgi:hypothetical protein